MVQEMNDSPTKMIIEEYYKYLDKCDLKVNKLDQNLGNRDAGILL